MGQVNVNEPGSGPGPARDEGAGTAASRNLTWAIAAVIVIAELAIALVYVVQHVHP